MKALRPTRFPQIRVRALWYRITLLMLPFQISQGAALDLVPYEIRHQSEVESPVDVSFLLKAPAGEAGFVHIENGHLVDGSGLRFRIWGVNLTGWNRGSTNLPPKAEAAHWARILAQKQDQLRAVSFSGHANSPA